MARVTLRISGPRSAEYRFEHRLGREAAASTSTAGFDDGEKVDSGPQVGVALLRVGIAAGAGAAGRERQKVLTKLLAHVDKEAFDDAALPLVGRQVGKLGGNEMGIGHRAEAGGATARRSCSGGAAPASWTWSRAAGAPAQNRVA